MKKVMSVIGTAAWLAAATAYAQDPAVETAPAGEPAPTAEAAPTTTTETAAVSSDSTLLAAPSYLGILGLYTLADSDRDVSVSDIKRGTGIDLLYGWQSEKNWGFEVHGAVQTFETGNTLRTDFYNYNLGLDLFYAFGDRTHFTPFLLIGGGASYNDIYPNTSNTQEDDYDFFANAGVGFVTGPVTKVGSLRIRGEARYVYDNYVQGDGDVRFGLGIEIPLFVEKIVTVQAPPAQTQVVEVPSGLRDSDGDGVVDDHDKCPDTPAGSRVDGDGCPFDKVINLKGVTFEFNKTRLRPDAQTILDWATGILKKYPDMKVEIAGHTDNVGSDEYNQKLSEGRAESVKGYFVEHGVPDTQLSVKGYGEAEPIADNASEDGRERNRRVELRILN